LGRGAARIEAKIMPDGDDVRGNTLVTDNNRVI